MMTKKYYALLLWGLVVTPIELPKLCNTVQELKDAIWQAWVDIDQETIDNLVHSIENRIFQVNRNFFPYPKALPNCVGFNQFALQFLSNNGKQTPV